MGLIFAVNSFQPCIPVTHDFGPNTGQVRQIGFRDFGDGIGCRERQKQHTGMFPDGLIKPGFEGIPQSGVIGESVLQRKAGLPPDKAP